jgi:hypothetical protein
VGKYGFGAVLEGFPDFVLLEFFARNVLRHERSPEVIRNFYPSTGGPRPACGAPSNACRKRRRGRRGRERQACYFVSMQTACTHCGQQHLLNDRVIAKHSKVQFRCTRCGQTTIVQIKRQADQTVVISPMPSFARSDAATATLKLPPVDEGLRLPAGADVVLTVTGGPEKGKTFTLSAPRVVIGRTGADLALNDPEISRHHCLLEVRDRTVNLKDLDSTNGTFLDEGRVRAALLQDGLEFRLGTSTIQLNIRAK